MTSLSSVNSLSSPRAMMDARIASAVSAGTISSEDQKALGTALDSIDSSLSSDATGRKSGGSIRDRIDSLIDAQVDGGTLTSDQADELKEFFAQGPGGPGRPGGPPPPPPPADEGSDTVATDSGTTTTVKTASEQLDALEAMLEKLRVSLADNNVYGGDRPAGSGLVFNGTA